MGLLTLISILAASSLKDQALELVETVAIFKLSKDEKTASKQGAAPMPPRRSAPLPPKAPAAKRSPAAPSQPTRLQKPAPRMIAKAAPDDGGDDWGSF